MSRAFSVIDPGEDREPPLVDRVLYPFERLREGKGTRLCEYTLDHTRRISLRRTDIDGYCGFSLAKLDCGP